jgi:hypothetical protein
MSEETSEVQNPITERRVWIRYPCEMKGTCRPVLTEAELIWASTTANISCGGIALAAERRFERNTLLAIEIKRPNDDRPMSCVVKVVRVAANPSGGWLLGCTFARAIADEEMRELIAWASPAAAAKDPFAVAP